MSTSSTSNDAQQWLPVTGEHPHLRFAHPIRKSQQDDRDYRLIKLQNGLEALLVSDANTDKAAASMNIGVGHLSDPVDMPGLAHFCEHLLFMGTEQYPKENAYSEFISAHGGHSNAYTSTNNTNYHFVISSDSLQGALARFSPFFYCPLFDPSCTTRELKAVDSEHKKNRQHDLWRSFQIDKTLSKKGARWAKFGSGCWESLIGGGKKSLRVAALRGTGIDLLKREEGIGSGAVTPVEEADVDDEGGDAGRETRRRVMEWWKKEYCATRMHLVVVGKESLDELTTMVSSLFLPIKNRQLPPSPAPAPYAIDSPWGPEQEGTALCIKSVMDFKAVGVKWVMPSLPAEYRLKAADFVSHFIAHEGPGSIHSYLKRRGWIVNLSAGASSGDKEGGWDFMRINMIVTQEGWENYGSLMQATFAYIDLLRNSALPPWYQEENKTLGEIAFRFKEKGSPDSYATKVSEAMSKPFAREDILSGSYLISEWDESAVRKILSYLDPSKGRVTLIARDDWDKIDIVRNSANKDLWQIEKWYQAEYKVLPYDLKTAGNITTEFDVKELYLPGPNEFIPKDFEVDKKEVTEVLKRPLKIRETALSTLWYKKDDQFWVPKASVILDIRSPLSSTTPLNALKTRLFGDLVQDALTEKTYDASLAGLSYDFRNTNEGVNLSVGGYNDKVPVLLKVLLEKIKGIKIDPDRLAVFKEQIKLEYQNFYLDSPYMLSDTEAKTLLWERIWSPNEKLAELDYITVESLQQHVTELLSRVHIRALVHGNVLKSDAIKIISIAEEVLGSRSLTATEKISMRSLILPPARNYVYEKTAVNKDEVNSSLTYYCQVGDVLDTPLRPTLSLFCQIAHEPCFDQLRTKEQLGYIVASGQWALTGSMGFRIVIQSERDPVYLESRVEAFLGSMKKMLVEMPEEEFAKQKKSLIDQKREKLKNLGDEAKRFWSHIDSGYNDFHRRENDAKTLESITREDVLALFNTYIHPSAPNRSKLSVHLCSQVTPEPKFGAAASTAFLSTLKSLNVQVDENSYRQLSAAESPVAAVQAFVQMYLEAIPGFDKAKIPEVQELIEKIAAVHPVVADNKAQGAKLADNVIFIKDPAEFKASLTLSKAATPVEDVSDLSVSKL